MIFEVLIPTIPHRHEVLCELLAELDRQMLPDVGVLLYRDNLDYRVAYKYQTLLDTSQAEYVACMDDDDWVAPDYFKRVLAALAQKPDYVGWPEVYEEGSLPPRIIVHSLCDMSEEYPGTQFTDIAHKNPIRRELALLGRWTREYGGDQYWADEVRASNQVKTEVFISDPVYHYRWHPGDEFRTPRKPMSEPLPELPSYAWLRSISA